VREVEEIIRGEITRHGPITMARFMEIALYEAGYGYYRNSRERFGVRGDFFTAGQLQPVFGELLADYASSISCNDSILDLGAGRGELREAFRGWNYLGHDWGGDPLPKRFTGLVIANEFFDALPVHLLRRRSGKWSEVLVAMHDDRLAFVDSEAAIDAPLRAYANRWGDPIPEGGLLEVNLASRCWMRRLGRMQERGRVLIIDYGYRAPELARFPQGTLMSYRRHAATADLLATPGSRDLTSHVNFSDLEEAAQEGGYRIVWNETMSRWILRVWDEAAMKKKWSDAHERWQLEWKRLMFGMGEVFRVLELERG
jgi:SAM-dependent MidA family methyltransferase